jgi:hypothetical protein
MPMATVMFLFRVINEVREYMMEEEGWARLLIVDEIIHINSGFFVDTLLRSVA